MSPLVHRGDAAAYALGALPRDEREAFEQLLWRDPATAEEVRAFAQVTAMLAWAAPAREAPHTLRARILAGS